MIDIILICSINSREKRKINIKHIGEKMKIKLDLIQNNCCFSISDCYDGVIALAWENMDDYDEYPEEGRIFFKFGETLEEVENKLAIKNVLMIN